MNHTLFFIFWVTSNVCTNMEIPLQPQGESNIRYICVWSLKAVASRYLINVWNITFQLSFAPEIIPRASCWMYELSGWRVWCSVGMIRKATKIHLVRHFNFKQNSLGILSQNCESLASLVTNWVTWVNNITNL